MKAFLLPAPWLLLQHLIPLHSAPFYKVGCTSAIQENLIALSLHYLWLMHLLREACKPTNKVVNPTFSWRKGAPPFRHFVHLALAVCLKLVPPAHCLLRNRLYIAAKMASIHLPYSIRYTSDREWTSAADVHFQSCASAIAFMLPSDWFISTSFSYIYWCHPHLWRQQRLHN